MSQFLRPFVYVCLCLCICEGVEKFVEFFFLLFGLSLSRTLVRSPACSFFSALLDVINVVMCNGRWSSLYTTASKLIKFFPFVRCHAPNPSDTQHTGFLSNFFPFAVVSVFVCMSLVMFFFFALFLFSPYPYISYFAFVKFTFAFSSVVVHCRFVKSFPEAKILYLKFRLNICVFSNMCMCVCVRA